MRTTAMVIAVVCVATVLSEVLGLGFLWYRGQLTASSIAEIRLALVGDDADSFDLNENENLEQQSVDDYAKQRVTRILELSTREEELDLLKRVVSDNRNGLKRDLAAFQQQKSDFEKQLKENREATASAAMEQTRGILLSLQPADAVENLMALSTQENVLLLKGMPEKSIAKILQQFLSGEQNEKLRGQEVFKAISQGEPSRSLIDGTLSALPGKGAAAN